MRRFRTRSWSRGVAALLLSVLALTAVPAPAQPPLESVGGWSVRDERGWCSASIARSADLHMRVTYDAAADLAEFFVWNAGWGWMREGEGYDVTLRFSTGRIHRPTAARSIRLGFVGEDMMNGLWMRLPARGFLEDFARAATMEAEVDARGLGTLSLSGTSAVVQRLRACANASARRHPSDRARLVPRRAGPDGAGVQIARPPVHRSGMITNEDYPAAALRAEEQGSVSIEMAVSADGIVTRCTVLASSGSAALDSTTCAIAQRRFRFAPAMDVEGRPVAGTATRTVVWIIPEPDPEPVEGTGEQ